MKIASIDIRPFTVPFRIPLRTARGTIDIRSGAILLARADDGTTGIGELAPLPPFSRESRTTAIEAAGVLARRLTGATVPEGPAALRDALDGITGGADPPPSAVLGIETALADLAARAAGRPLARWLNPAAASRVPVNALLAADAEGIDGTIDRIRRRGHRTVKIKVGTGPIEADRARVEALRRALGGGVAIRLDANRAWTFDRAAGALSRFEPLGIEYIEEPLAPPDLDRLPALHAATGVPVALDETVLEPGPFGRLLGSGAVAAVILKPSLTGGLERTLELARRARAAGASAVITTLFETGVGVAACLHLAAALGPEPPACGLDTLGWLRWSGIRETLPVRGGTIEVPDGPGLGVTLAPEGTAP